jgi:hypothetical protein
MHYTPHKPRALVIEDGGLGSLLRTSSVTYSLQELGYVVELLVSKKSNAQLAAHIPSINAVHFWSLNSYLILTYISNMGLCGEL